MYGRSPFFIGGIECTWGRIYQYQHGLQMAVFGCNVQRYFFLIISFIYFTASFEQQADCLNIIANYQNTRLFTQSKMLVRYLASFLLVHYYCLRWVFIFQSRKMKSLSCHYSRQNLILVVSLPNRSTNLNSMWYRLLLT